MGSAYTILGKQVPAHVLSILTLGSVAAGVAIPKVLGSNDAKKNVPAKPAPPVAQSKEDDFDLEKFINELTKEETK
ncbi:unnamed protein product [Candida parapsilosis]|uniref:ATP synthase subunit K, mitochondrial n=1 Tax=Candida parapsilosis (strain CDC 317 / ATCC MYA-4646) TaxID=578454 RepID=G8BE29_CANPC|nr:uncharacterized protein CPAR2_211700 [Candida parapsilosis]CAD1809067.1 unnamed protein product [Candida parapsilosis]CCE43526.1 hypothetical protein CPAR2_211700 [Candida parapsilosis]